MRVSWIVLAGIALAYAVWTALGPAGRWSLGCRKMPDATCDIPMYHAVGVWPLVVIGAVLAGPPALAALASATRVSWLMLGALVVVAFLGLVNWSEFWGSLLFAIPLLVMSFVVTLLQMVFAQYDTGRTD
ncbi:MAG: ABC transporter permease [Gordonia sp. (in: high G+C Gram-positive bacteria)]|uniref:ABC transporter permease n=1 Tax=Gordonia sp. (in: high G+C Gram-positive bacteria) TaxID=84139 RepID=UPI0039E5A2E7